MNLKNIVKIFLIVYIIFLLILMSKKSFELFSQAKIVVPNSPFQVGNVVLINNDSQYPNNYNPNKNNFISSPKDCSYYAKITNVLQIRPSQKLIYKYTITYINNISINLPKTFTISYTLKSNTYVKQGTDPFQKASSNDNNNFSIEDLFDSSKRRTLIGCHLLKMKQLQNEYQKEMLSDSQSTSKNNRGKYYAYFWDSIMNSLGNNLHQVTYNNEPINLQFLGKGFDMHEIIANTFTTYRPPATVLNFTINYQDGSDLCPINSIYNPTTGDFMKPVVGCANRQHLVGFVKNRKYYDGVFSISASSNSTFEVQIAGMQNATLLKYTFDSLADKKQSLSNSIQDIMSNASSVDRMMNYLRNLSLTVLLPLVTLNTSNTPQSMNTNEIRVIYDSIIQLYTATYQKYTSVNPSYIEVMVTVEEVTQSLADTINARANSIIIEKGIIENATLTLEEAINTLFASPGVQYIPGWSQTINIPTSQLDYSTLQFEAPWNLNNNGLTITTSPILNSRFEVYAIPLSGVNANNKNSFRKSYQIVIKVKKAYNCTKGWKKLFQVYVNKNIIFSKIDNSNYIQKLFTNIDSSEELEYSATSASAIKDNLEKSLSSLNKSTISEVVTMSSSMIQKNSIQKNQEITNNSDFGQSVTMGEITIPNDKILSVNKTINGKSETKVYQCPYNTLPNVCKNTLIENKKNGFLYVESKPTSTDVSDLVNYLSIIDNMLIFRKHVKQLVITFREFENPVFRNRVTPNSADSDSDEDENKKSEDEIYKDDMKFLLTMQLALHNLNDYYHIIAINTNNPDASAKTNYVTKPPDYFTSSYKTSSGMLPIISVFSNMTVTYLRRETGLKMTTNSNTWVNSPTPLFAPTIKRITPFSDKTNANREAELKTIRESVLSGKTLGQLVWNY